MPSCAGADHARSPRQRRAEYTTSVGPLHGTQDTIQRGRFLVVFAGFLDPFSIFGLLRPRTLRPTTATATACIYDLQGPSPRRPGRDPTRSRFGRFRWRFRPTCDFDFPPRTRNSHAAVATGTRRPWNVPEAAGTGSGEVEIRTSVRVFEPLLDFGLPRARHFSRHDAQDTRAQ